jgi:hypothetical protein
MVKLVMTWDIRPGKEEAHIEFIAKTFIPRMVKLDVRLVDIWSTLWGQAPQISMGWIADDRPSVAKMLSTREWRALREQLDPFVTEFRYRIVPIETIV